MHWFLSPPPSGDQTRPQFVVNVILSQRWHFRSPLRRRIARPRSRVTPLGWTLVGTVGAYFVLGGKSYYALPVVSFALAAGAIPLDHWARLDDSEPDGRVPSPRSGPSIIATQD